MSEPFGDKQYDYGVGYPTPYSIPEETSCFVVPVPKDTAWQAIFTGLLLTLSQSEAWQQFEGAISKDDAAARWDAMVQDFFFNSMLGCGAQVPPNIRYFPDDDAVQIKEPDGDWVANVDADPRHSPSNKFPPIVSDNPQCDAAANMVAWIHNFIDTLNTITDEAGIITSFFIDVLELLWGAGIFLALITLFAETLIALGLHTVIDAFTPEVYDALLCIFFCSIEADGSITTDDLAVINTKIGAEIGGTVATVLSAMFFIMGEVGLSNVGSTGTETGDCSDCDCQWCYEFDFTTSDGGWTQFTDGVPGATYVGGVGWVDKTSGGTRGTFIQSPLFDLTHVTKIEFTYIAAGNVTSTVDYLQASGGFPMVDVCAGALGEFTVTWDGDIEADRAGLQVGNSTSFPAGSSVIVNVKFHGTGVNPFGSDNC